MQEDVSGRDIAGLSSTDGERSGEERRDAMYPERRAFDRLLFPLASRCMNAPIEQLDRVIEQGLKEMSRYFGGDRMFLWEVTSDERQALLTHYHAEAGFEPKGRSLLHETLPYIFESVVGSAKNLSISHPDDLPPSALVDRHYMARLGIRSAMVIPLMVGGSHRGALSVACIRAERAWTNADMFCFQRFGIVLTSALDRGRSQKLLDQRMRFEAMVADLSAVILKSSSSEIDREIERGCARVAEFFKADRCGLLSVRPDEQYAVVTHAWYGEGIDKVSGDINLAVLFPYGYEMLFVRRTHRRTVRLDDMPPEAATDRQSYIAMGVLSSLDVPVVYDGHVSYVIAIQSLSEEREWPEEYVPRLRLLGELFASALIRRRSEAIIRDNEARLATVIDVAALGFYEMTDSPKSIYQDDRMRQLLGIPPEEEHRVRDFWFEHIHPDDLSAISEKSRKVLSGESSSETGEYRYLHPQRGLIWLSQSSRIVSRDPQGRPTRLVGVFRDITKLKQDEEEIKQSCAEIARLKEKLEAENIYLREEMSQAQDGGEIIGRSDPIKYVHYRISQVAAQDTTVLIVGETGTGKGLVARAVHRGSSRRDRPMIHVNCAVLPGNLIESELFGREKGAFTGAQVKQIGRFELADKGTIFLDEIAELPVELQAKLLRVVETGEFERLGDPHSVKVDVRIISSTNRNLQEEIRSGRFREDLFYRLNVFPITVPPLRQRSEDIPLIVDALISRLNKKMGKRITSVPKQVLLELQNHDWPGNVRELENVIERAVIMSKGPDLYLADRIGPSTPDLTARPAVPEAASTELADIERVHIRKTLESFKWKIEGSKGAAHALGMKPSTLRDKMQKLDIRRPGSS